PPRSPRATPTPRSPGWSSRSARASRTTTSTCNPEPTGVDSVGDEGRRRQDLRLLRLRLHLEHQDVAADLDAVARVQSGRVRDALAVDLGARPRLRVRQHPLAALVLDPGVRRLDAAVAGQVHIAPRAPADTRLGPRQQELTPGVDAGLHTQAGLAEK